MGTYIDRDIKYNFSGDIEIGSNGDLILADPQDTFLSSVNFWLRTDHGDYSPDITVGCNIGKFIGQNNEEEILTDIKTQVTSTLINRVLVPGDVRVEVLPIDINTVAIGVKLKGDFFNESGQPVPTREKILVYAFPYIEGKLKFME